MLKYLIVGFVFLYGCAPEPWPAEDQRSFMELCKQAVYGLYDTETGNTYCACVLEKMMEEYPNPDTSKDIPESAFETYAIECDEEHNLQPLK